MKNHFSTIPEALKQIKRGRMIIIADSPTRENEGDFYIPTDTVTPQHILTMIKKGGGLVCAAITKAQAHCLSLPLMIDPINNTEKTKVNFTVSVNAKRGITTGVSAFDRTKTIKVVADSKSKPSDLVRPGHVFCLVAKSGGVMERPGHTEAAVDLARLSGLSPAGVLCEIVGDNGRMAQGKDLIKLSKALDMTLVSIDDLKTYLKNHPLSPLPPAISVVRLAESTLPTKFGTFNIIIYQSVIDNREHAVLILGKKQEPMLTRIHSQCFTGDTLYSLRCDCREQLHQSMSLIQKSGSGIIVYLNQEGRGIGLANKIKAYSLQDKGYDTVEANHSLGFPADARNYEAAANILRDLGIERIELLTNNPEKEKQLSSFGIRITQCIPLEVYPNGVNTRYLVAKKQKLGHRLTRI